MIRQFSANGPTTQGTYALSQVMLRALVCAFLVGQMTYAQNPQAARPQSASNKLPLRAGIVLSPEFCATKRRQSIALKDVLNVGKATCAQLFAALSPVFSDLSRLEKVPTTGTSTAQITLIPRFVDVSATQQPFLPSSHRKLVILLEWTIQDAMGRTLWLQTVQGSSEHKAGWMITTKKVTKMVDAAVGDLAKESIAKISAAPELQQISR